LDDPGAAYQLNLILFSIPQESLLSLAVSIAGLIILIILSAMTSGAEVAFFSLKKQQRERLAASDSKGENMVAELLRYPKRLLATLLIANNFVNIGIVILSAYITSIFSVPGQEMTIVGWVIQVLLVTFIILLFGEVMPKIYANHFSEKFAVLIVYPILFLRNFFWWIGFSRSLVFLSDIVDKRLGKKGHDISVDDLSYALDLTSTKENMESEDNKILRGIVTFGNTEVKQIMKPRMDVKALEHDTVFTKLLPLLVEAGYSRLPVYKESFDNVAGIIYSKDMLAHLDKKDDFKWQELMREPFFVPENKKIDDLLAEFQKSKVHLAVVVDEYGGTSGIVTLEDVMEEIVGDITDEFDDDELVYSKLDDRNFVFEGKISLSNFYRITGIDGEAFEESKGEADSLAGFILEKEGKIPAKNSKIHFGNIEFTIESVDTKKIKRVKVTILNDTTETSDNGLSSVPLIVLAILSGTIFLSSCGEEDYTPKPRGFFRIELPEKKYQSYQSDCPFTFEYPAYSTIENDTKGLSEPCWINLSFPEFKGTLHISYKSVDGNIVQYLEDATRTNQ
jgi:putative hemolysin